jgi:hypothetical protein
MTSPWIPTDALLARLGVHRETLRRLRLRGILTPGKHFRRPGCCTDRGPLQWHADNVEATLTSWAKRNLAA